MGHLKESCWYLECAKSMVTLEIFIISTFKRNPDGNSAWELMDVEEDVEEVFVVEFDVATGKKKTSQGWDAKRDGVANVEKKKKSEPIAPSTLPCPNFPSTGPLLSGPTILKAQSVPKSIKMATFFVLLATTQTKLDSLNLLKSYKAKMHPPISTSIALNSLYKTFILGIILS